VESIASWCCSKNTDTIPTTTSKYTIDINTSWFHMESLLQKLDVLSTGGHDFIRLYAFYRAAKKHTGITNPHYMWGRAVDYHDF
jgi:hypothetical protein